MAYRNSDEACREALERQGSVQNLFYQSSRGKNWWSSEDPPNECSDPRPWWTVSAHLRMGQASFESTFWPFVSSQLNASSTSTGGKGAKAHRVQCWLAFGELHWHKKVLATGGAT